MENELMDQCFKYLDFYFKSHACRPLPASKDSGESGETTNGWLISYDNFDLKSLYLVLAG